MADRLRLFIAAGEPSGDLIAADLLHRLKARREVTVSGVGGAALEGEGLASLFPMSDLSVMGISDVIARYPLLWWRMRQTVNAILTQKPDVAVLVDSQVFSATVAKNLRRAGFRGRILLYVAPAVWAWKPERAKALNGLFDEVLAVLPFEPKAMADLGGPATTYVGHPALKRIAFRNAVPERGPLLLLPGSRGGELRRHLPIMGQVASAFAKHPRVSELILPTAASHASELAATVRNWSAPVTVVSGKEKDLAFSTAVAAAAVSGTVTLELALSGVPMAVVYVGDNGQYRRWIAAGSPRAALPNILAGAEVVPEKMGAEAQPDWLISEIGKLLDKTDVAEAQLAAFRALRQSMERGISDPAKRVLASL